MELINPFEIIVQKLDAMQAEIKAIKIEAAPIKYVSIAKACEVLDVSRPKLYDLINTGVLTKYRVGGTPRLLLSEVQESAKKCK